MNNISGEINGKETLQGELCTAYGVTPDITIGQIETLEEGQKAYVQLAENSTRSKPVFNFGIPRGFQGEQGERGEKGEQGEGGNVVVVSDFEPTGENRKEIWVQKSPNMIYNTEMWRDDATLYWYSKFIAVEPNTTYAMKVFSEQTTRVYAYFYDKDQIELSQNLFCKWQTEGTFTTPNEAAYVRLVTINEPLLHMYDVSLVKGSIVPTEYTKFGSASVNMLVNDTYEEFWNRNYATKEDLENSTTNLHYTTEEKVIGTWIDGKPIYRQIMQFTSKSGIGVESTAIQELDMLVNFSGKTVQPNGNITDLNYYKSESDRTSCYFNNTLRKFKVECGTSYGFGEVTIIAEYTKTTD